MILVISPPTDDHTVPVARELVQRGKKCVVLDVAEFPEKAAISISFEPGLRMRSSVRRDVDSFDLSDVETVWMRRLHSPQPHPALMDAGFASAEVQHVLVGLGQALGHVRWVNRLGALAMDGGWGKVAQLDTARACGLEVPRTLITNDPGRALEFVDSCPAGAVHKPLASVELPGRDRVWRALFTEKIERDYLLTRLDRVQRCPVVFQELVPKHRELRVTVMGERAFACALDSQSQEVSRVDYRHRYLAVPRERHALPAEVESALVRTLGALGLVFGTADMILTPDGRYVFLEVNQQGQWLWTSDVFREGELLGAFCDLLG